MERAVAYDYDRRDKFAFIQAITKVYVRDLGDYKKLYVEWKDHSGKPGGTSGPLDNFHMKELLLRAKREGVPLGKVTH